MNLPDAMVCLWLTLAMLCFWLTEAPQLWVPRPGSVRAGSRHHRLLCSTFATCCALGVLTKGLIGIVFPVAIVALYLLLTRGLRGAFTRIRQLHPFTSALVFLAIAAPWHIAIAFANPTQGHPGGLSFTLHPAASAGHWQVPLPSDGNVHGWAWFYFVNEQLLRYLNLRVPRDYDTVPLYLFWGLCLIWLMPWSAFVFKALGTALPLRIPAWRGRFRTRTLTSPERTPLLLAIWAALPLLFFSLSTRQEYYVLPALPAFAILIAAWLARQAHAKIEAQVHRRSAYRCTAVLLALGAVFAAASFYFLLHTRAPAPSIDLAALLQTNPGDYAMSMGHFLDLNARALGLFRLPLLIAAFSLLIGPLAALLLRKMEASVNPTRLFLFFVGFRIFGKPFAKWNGRKTRVHAANLALAAGAFGFLLAAHLGLQTFAPVLSSAQLAEAIAPQVHADDLIVIHQEYEYGSTLGFYLQRPGYAQTRVPRPSSARAGSGPNPVALNPIHILTDPGYNGTPNYGRSSNLWYGSYFPDAPAIFETAQSLAQKWPGQQRIFLWQDLGNQPSPLPAALSPVYVIAKSGGKEIVSNQPNRP